ncbi:DUF1254-domain-containing protein [Aaosphaeria arxii CBS 175.79]|uniref:DUF1254-domain-containing protein n=1 Tax=Aaosphaeria arxii CBS 175.79 TaxID=1450172 RepID=A0A6A5Y979_9PLEO|nr:DUF1254-domain-containing protein [Aaosphaeria arxii CBS 175.79]KAF2021154.1 DUF1254-domain-containing protein [Aaosphaeria arxii CBS 175.79]
MKIHLVFVSLLSAVVYTQQVVIVPESQCRTSCHQNALAFAYTYGFPLYSFAKYVNPRYLNNETNSLYHSRKLAGADDTGFVRPNADTVYSVAFLDLSENDIEIQVPDFGERYWVWPFYDMYANDLANIGSITNSSAGKYLLRFDSENPGVVTEGLKGGYKAYLNLPTPYGITLPRILVEAGTDDIVAVNKLQDGFGMAVLPRFSPPVAPALNLSMFSRPEFVYTPGDNTLAEVVLRLTAELAPYNEPYVKQDRSWVRQTLLEAGIHYENNSFVQPPDTNLTTAVATANASNEALQITPGLTLRLGGNWTCRASRVLGAFGSFYTARYSTASRGYLALTSEQVTYPVNNDFVIGKDQAVLFTFSRKPEINKGGFWSLTVYNGEQYLVKNDLNRYALGDRSNLTFPDGTSYNEEDVDGPFNIIIQANDVPPPSNWTSNWLPAPDGGGEVKITLRFYGATDAMTNGDWEYPEVSVVNAIRG